MKLLDTCVLVASNALQAENLHWLVQKRIEAGLYPREIRFIVVSDPENRRVGSGGGTLYALSKIESQVPETESVLLIHAGGESRRMPSYAPEAKIFAPLPIPSPSILPPVVLDVQLSLFMRYPWNPGELVVCSGDVAFDFDTESLPKERGDVYGFAAAASFEMGSQHGVFKFGKNRNSVLDFCQKETVEFLAKHAALEGSHSCALDIGVVGFSPSGRATLSSLAKAIVSRNTNIIQAVSRGELQFDLYLEVLIACLNGIPYDVYEKKVVSRTSCTLDVLKAIHSAFRSVELHAYLTRKTRFYHFGALSDFVHSCIELAKSEIIPFYADENAEIKPATTPDGILQENCINVRCAVKENGRDIYIEGCTQSNISAACGSNMFLGLNGQTLEFPIPWGICIDQRNTQSGNFLLTYHLHDTWKPQTSLESLIYCGIPLRRWLSERKLDQETIFSGTTELSLDNARIIVKDLPANELQAYWDASYVDAGWIEMFRSRPRYTIREINDADSAQRRDTHRSEIRAAVIRSEILSGRGWLSISERDFCLLFNKSDIESLILAEAASEDDLLRIYRRKLLSSIVQKGTFEQISPGTAQSVLDPKQGWDAIGNLGVDYVSGLAMPGPLHRGVKLDQIVWARSPVRLDLAGGWTDTPPYTLRKGGAVVNVAVDLNGQPPIQVFCRPDLNRTITIHSIDMGTREVVEDFDSLEGFNKPDSPFSLPKAALCLLGLTQEKTRCTRLSSALEDMGGGFELSLLSAVPKGSGLGTSSILGATILAALERFFSLPVSSSYLFQQVLQMEQMLTTGGGWQDQIGGVAGGVKLIQASPGLRPQPLIYSMDPYLFQDAACASCFTLYYTGITRLAKNILQDVVDKVNSMEPAYLFTLGYLKRLAYEAREAISLHDLPALAQVLNSSWEANKRIHQSTTNEDIERLRGEMKGLYSGMKLLGAGGGGYVLFLSESIELANRLRMRLSQKRDDRARVVEMSINTVGLQLSVS